MRNFVWIQIILFSHIREGCLSADVMFNVFFVDGFLPSGSSWLLFMTHLQILFFFFFIWFSQVCLHDRNLLIWAVKPEPKSRPDVMKADRRNGWRWLCRLTSASGITHQRFHTGFNVKINVLFHKTPSLCDLWTPLKWDGGKNAVLKTKVKSTKRKPDRSAASRCERKHKPYKKKQQHCFVWAAKSSNQNPSCSRILTFLLHYMLLIFFLAPQTQEKKALEAKRRLFLL